MEDEKQQEMEDVEALINEAKRLYGSERVIAAEKRIVQATNIVRKRDRDRELRGEEKSHVLAGLASRLTESDRVIAAIRHDADTVRKIIADANDDSGWSVQRRGDAHADDIRVLYTHTSGSPLLTLRISGEVDAPLLGPLAVMNEVDLYETWIPILNFGVGKVGLRSAHTIEQITTVSKVVFLDLICPWPFDHRELVLVGRGIDLLEEKGTIIVALKSPTLFAEDEPIYPVSDSDNDDQIAHMKDTQRLAAREEEWRRERKRKAMEEAASGDGARGKREDSAGGRAERRVQMEAVGHVIFRYISPTRCFCQVQMKVDVKLSYIPSPILNFVTRTLASTIFSFYKRRCVDVFRDEATDDEGQKRINGDNEAADDSMLTSQDDMSPCVQSASSITKTSGGTHTNLHRQRIESASEFYDFVRSALGAFDAVLRAREVEGGVC